jgi:hypothetical protein
MKKYILVAITLIFVCSVAQANNGIEAISIDSKIAASSQDLNTAKELSGKQIDGMMLGLKAGPVQIDGDIQVSKKEELVLSESKKLSLKGNVPTLTKSETKSTESEPGFFEHMGAAIVSPIVTPVLMTVAGAVAGALVGNELGNTFTGVVGGVLGGIGGLVLGIVLIPVSIISNVFSGLSQLFKGNF